MNIPDEGRDVDPREWELQERAMRAEPGHRRIAQALRRSPGEPPADFAASVAALAQGAAAAIGHGATQEGRIERWLLRALAFVLVASSLGALAVFGGDWLAVVQAGFAALVPMLGGATALNWALAAGACVGLSWVFAQGAPRLPSARR